MAKNPGGKFEAEKPEVGGSVFDQVQPLVTAIEEPRGDEIAKVEGLSEGEIERELRRVQREVRRRLWKRDLKEFIRQAWPLVEPTREFQNNWHIERLCQLLQDVSDGKIKRLLVNVPPGTMKSLLVSVLWPAWEWASHPELRFLSASYSSHLTIRDNLKVRSIVTSPWYQQNFGVKLTEDQNAKTLFKTADGGWRVASSVGGPGTGEHPDRIIIDDPLTADQARSEVEREVANTWFDQTISTRGVTRDTAIIVVMQRLHEEDLAGHLLARGGWKHVCWPMRYEGGSEDPRTTPGELLWPEVFTEKIVRQLELDLGPYGTAGQLQQRPAPEGGGLFKKEWFKIVDAAPAMARRARGWDTASSEGKGDWTVGVRIAEAGGNFYIEDVRREQLGPAGVDAMMRQTAQMDGKSISQREEREGGSAGKAVIAARVKLLVGYDYAGVAISGDKVTRAKPYRAQVEAGNVYLVRGAWNAAYLEELALFPNGRHDDQVDGSSCAFNAVLLEPAPVAVTGEVVMLPHVSQWSLGRGVVMNPALGTSFEE